MHISSDLLFRFFNDEAISVEVKGPCPSWNSEVKLVLFSIFVTHSAINGNNSKTTIQKKSKQCDHQKGKAGHVSRPSFSVFARCNKH